MLVARPSAAAARAMRAALGADGGRYVFGEQDFLNAFWGGEHAQLSKHYHCFAEEFGVARRLGGARRRTCLLYTSPSPRDRG